MPLLINFKLVCQWLGPFTPKLMQLVKFGSAEKDAGYDIWQKEESKAERIRIREDFFDPVKNVKPYF